MFSLDEKQLEKLNAFVAEQDAKVVAVQKQEPSIAGMIGRDHTTGREYPYMGAIGGGLTYEFTPTALGTVCKVTYCGRTMYEASIDLTDYDSW